jgi:hypothetical protein
MESQIVDQRVNRLQLTQLTNELPPRHAANVRELLSATNLEQREARSSLLSELRRTRELYVLRLARGSGYCMQRRSSRVSDARSASSHPAASASTAAVLR